MFSIGDLPCLERSHLATVSAEMWAIVSSCLELEEVETTVLGFL